MVHPAIDVHGLGKSYLLGGNPFWAFRHLSFRVERGDVVGIVGRNGAGKTTLLRVLGRITEPTEGVAVLRGRMGVLLETGTGFHNDLSGRENVYLNGAILGMNPREINRRFDEIVDFSGVGRFIDSPIKTYSSGMRSRLAFSVAAHLDTEILLVDEVLAVGDMAFQEKCLRKMDDLSQRRERTILFVSHNMGAVQSLCNRAILLEGGRVHTAGGTDEVVRAYVDLLRGSGGPADLRSMEGRPGSGRVRLTGMRLENATGQTVSSIPAGQGARLVFEYESHLTERPKEVLVTVVFVGTKGARVFGLPSEVIRADLSSLGEKGAFVCVVPKLPLLPGHYEIVASCVVDRELTDKITNMCSVTVSENNYYGTGRMPTNQFGDVFVDFEWRLGAPVAS